MELSKAQKEKIIGDLSQLFGRATLRCDGYEITLQVERFKGFKYRVMTYVNGTFEGKWIHSDSKAPESRYLRALVRPTITKAFRLKLEKAIGKRAVAKEPRYNGTYTMYLPDWSSGRAAINHLCKVSESIELITCVNAFTALTSGGSGDVPTVTKTEPLE